MNDLITKLTSCETLLQEIKAALDSMPKYAIKVKGIRCPYPVYVGKSGAIMRDKKDALMFFSPEEAELYIDTKLLILRADTEIVPW